ncbi:MAG: DUF4136 domain-containing protein [Planctomycetota bacterium]|jgi:hypothetical protein
MWKKLLPGLCLGLCACSGVNLVWHVDPEVEFAEFRFYEWEGVRAAPTPQAESCLRSVTNEALNVRGMVEASMDVDFRVIAYFDPAPERARSGPDTESMGIGMIIMFAIALVGGGGGFRVGDPASRGGVQSNSSWDRVLRIEFLDAESGRPVWQGMALGPFAERMSRRERSRLIETATRELMENFPPRLPEDR